MPNFIALVVEDDELQREIVSDLLKDNGLDVVECRTAEAAELVLGSTGTELRTLVTDISLAGDMSGVALAEFAKRSFPHINVVMISGSLPAHIPADTAFLMKPFNPHQLLELCCPVRPLSR
jgi:DNA-binding NtrC family response regulator